MLMKNTPIFDQAMLNFPQNLGVRFNINSKILKKKKVSILLSVEQKCCGIHHTLLLTDEFHEPRFCLFSIISERFLKQ